MLINDIRITGAWSRVGTCTSSKNRYTIPNLIEGKEYLFRVTAENEVGYGDALEMKKPVLTKSPYGEYTVPLE